MALTTIGSYMIADAVMGGSTYTKLTNAAAHLGVGDSTDAFDASEQDLQAASNKLRKAMESTFPSRSNNVLTLKSSFGTSEANFAWAEWGVFNASSSGEMFSRKVESFGTKSSGTWDLTVTLTFTA